MTRGEVPNARASVGRRNVDCWNTVIEATPASAPTSLRQRGHLVYRAVGQRITENVGGDALTAPPPPAGRAPDVLRRPNFEHSDITQYSEHLRRLPTFRGTTDLQFYTTGCR